MFGQGIKEDISNEIFTYVFAYSIIILPRYIFELSKYAAAKRDTFLAELGEVISQNEVRRAFLTPRRKKTSPTGSARGSESASTLSKGKIRGSVKLSDAGP